MRRPTTAIRTAAVAVGVLYAAALYLSGVHLGGLLRRALMYAPTVVSIGAVIWDLWLWRWPLVRRLVKRPHFGGLWAGTLKPTDESHIPEGGNSGPIPSFMVVNQSFWSVSVRQYTKESSSGSRSFFWRCVDDPTVEELTITYENAPRPQFQHRSTRHYGTSHLRGGGKEPTELTGEYFADRYSAGEITMVFVDRSTKSASFEGSRSRATKRLKNAKYAGKRRLAPILEIIGPDQG